MRTARPTAGMCSWAATAARTAVSTDVKPAAMPSPIVAKISHPRGDRVAQHGEMGLDELGHARALLPLPGRANDVGEQQAHRGAPATA